MQEQVTFTLSKTESGQQLLSSSSGSVLLKIDVTNDPIVDEKVVTVATNNATVLANSLSELSATHTINFDTLNNSMSFTPKNTDSETI